MSRSDMARRGGGGASSRVDVAVDGRIWTEAKTTAWSEGKSSVGRTWKWEAVSIRWSFLNRETRAQEFSQRSLHL